jgi:hypothetical protein
VKGKLCFLQVFHPLAEVPVFTLGRKDRYQGRISRKGIEEGYQGREDIKEGRKEERKEGRKEGREKGYQGKKEGRKEGKNEGTCSCFKWPRISSYDLGAAPLPKKTAS